MAKIIHFPYKDKDLIEQLEYITEQAREGKIKNYVFAAELQGGDEGLIATSYYNADVGQKQVLNSHIQLDIIAAVVEVNFCE
ncbi:hypothetical protein FQP34_00085 [Peribacillus simplex]|uniref:Uncharacterized protein n=1 Tax=Peribacillus simplex TaxID=1478 RepID=A0A8B5Y3K9_9BACI|nr:hypothetical protein [Peribacillus simplex]MED3911399.1 hypothetical protein [Peribacillus simplex]TVX83693.1 hypothetical protein FQP34_00085 [Peribacillus simplex]